MKLHWEICFATFLIQSLINMVLSMLPTPTKMCILLCRTVPKLLSTAQPSLVISVLKHARTWPLTAMDLMCWNIYLNKCCIPNTDDIVLISKVEMYFWDFLRMYVFCTYLQKMYIAFGYLLATFRIILLRSAPIKKLV